MTRKNPKIEIATPDDVAKYTPGEPSESVTASSPGTAGGAPSDAPDAGGQVSGGAPPADVEVLRAEVEQWKDKCLRAKAELANYQRRSNQERAEAIKFANAEFAKSLLNIVDDLERALAHAGDPSADGDAVAHALKLIHENLAKVLKEHHIESIDAAGLPFDPACHQALMQRPSEEHPEMTVLDVLQKGYRLHDRVLRPAKVVVSKAPEKPDPEGAATTE